MTVQTPTRTMMLQILHGKAKYLKVWEETAAGRGGEYPEVHQEVFETADQLAAHPTMPGEKVFELTNISVMV